MSVPWDYLVLPGSPHSSESLEVPGDKEGKGEGKQASTDGTVHSDPRSPHSLLSRVKLP